MKGNKKLGCRIVCFGGQTTLLFLAQVGGRHYGSECISFYIAGGHKSVMARLDVKVSLITAEKIIYSHAEEKMSKPRTLA